jgi:hypothetical protein
MKQRRKMTITKVHRQTITVTTATTIVRCPFCEREVETLSTVEAGALLVTADRTLDAGVAPGQVHIIHTLNDGPRVCKDSLLQCRGFRFGIGG